MTTKRKHYSGDNPLAIGYAWLKTHLEYSDAVDC
jgi:hypothetical protein